MHRPRCWQLLTVLWKSVPAILSNIFYVSRIITKPTKWSVRPAKTQISLGICPVWSESSLCAQWAANDPRFLHADSEDWSEWADTQADLSLRWAHGSLCWFCHVVAHFFFFAGFGCSYRVLYLFNAFSAISTVITFLLTNTTRLITSFI